MSNTTEAADKRRAFGPSTHREDRTLTHENRAGPWSRIYKRCVEGKEQDVWRVIEEETNRHTETLIGALHTAVELAIVERTRWGSDD